MCCRHRATSQWFLKLAGRWTPGAPGAKGWPGEFVAAGEGDGYVGDVEWGEGGPGKPSRKVRCGLRRWRCKAVQDAGSGRCMTCGTHTHLLLGRS